MKKDRIFINISTVNSFLNGRILNVNECCYIYTFNYHYSQTIFFVTNYPLWILLIDNAYRFMKKDRIFINISTVNSFLNGRILNVNECFIKWVYM
jgi:hypothetical protein